MVGGSAAEGLGGPECGLLRHRTDVSQPGSLRSGMCRPGGPIDESGKSTGALLSNGWRREANGKPSFLWLNCG
jgi:hypothetical protein